MIATLDEPRLSYAHRKAERLRLDVEEWENTPQSNDTGLLEDLIRDANRLATDLSELLVRAAKLCASPSLPAQRAGFGYLVAAARALGKAVEAILACARALPKAPVGLGELERHREATLQRQLSDLCEGVFTALAERWKAETEFLSSPDEIAAHWAYQRIVQLGAPMVPLVLRELRREPHLWFAALRALTGANPVPAEARGKVSAMADAWVRWGEANQLI